MKQRKSLHLQGVVACTFNPSTQEAGQVDLCEFEASLVYRVSSRTDRAVSQRNRETLPRKTKKKSFSSANFILLAFLNIFLTNLSVVKNLLLLHNFQKY